VQDYTQTIYRGEPLPSRAFGLDLAINIGESRVSKESPDDFRKLLKPTESSVRDLGQIGFAEDGLTTSLRVLDVVPHPFVRVELRRVSGKLKETQPTIS
jgi:hypothetical protein